MHTGDLETRTGARICGGARILPLNKPEELILRNEKSSSTSVQIIDPAKGNDAYPSLSVSADALCPPRLKIPDGPAAPHQRVRPTHLSLPRNRVAPLALFSRTSPTSGALRLPKAAHPSHSPPPSHNPTAVDEPVIQHLDNHRALFTSNSSISLTGSFSSSLDFQTPRNYTLIFIFC